MPHFFTALWMMLRRHGNERRPLAYPQPPLPVLLWEEAWIACRRAAPLLAAAVAAAVVLVAFSSATPGPVLDLLLRMVAAAGAALALGGALIARRWGKT